jgi:hypothetical protein
VKSGAICLLIVNKIPEMPRISIASILDTTNEPIHIGYVDKSDVQEFESNPRISLLDLSAEYERLDFALNDKNYTGWANNDFFKIVQLKWVLLKRIMDKGFTFVVYSDLDVIWQLNAYQEVKECFGTRHDISIQIQSFSRSLSDPKLCMGFVAFRNDEKSRQFIERGASRHKIELLVNPRIGDDDIATILYQELEYPSWLCELPQTTFPVGVSLNLFRGKAVFPGLVAQEPFIFHANFVVGLENKVLLMKRFLSRKKRKQYNAQFTPTELILFISKALKYYLTRILSR